jgi:hypothetical protein
VLQAESTTQSALSFNCATSLAVKHADGLALDQPRGVTISRRMR